MKFQRILITALPGIVSILTGIRFRLKRAVAVSVIGGADGPTSIFIAGKTGSSISTLLIAIGILLLVITLIRIFKKN